MPRKRARGGCELGSRVGIQVVGGLVRHEHIGVAATARRQSAVSFARRKRVHRSARHVVLDAKDAAKLPCFAPVIGGEVVQPVGHLVDLLRAHDV